MRRLVTIVVFLLLWGGWFLGFPYYLRWIEGISFFSTLPDFTMVHFHLPWDLFRYCGAFLMQFYAYPAAGAAIQAAFPVLCSLCIVLMIKRLFKDPEGLGWAAFIPLPIFVYILADDMHLDRSCILLTCLAGAALAIYLLSLVIKGRIQAPKFLQVKWLGLALPLVAAGVSLYLLYDGAVDRDYEEIGRLEYYGEQGKWAKILEEVTPRDAARNELKRKYALLALSETGKLAESALRYGLSGPEDFIFTDPKTIMTFNFNMLFYRSAGMVNPIVRMAYQQETLSHTGMNFFAARILADAYLDVKDYGMAKKYIDILSHSTCHRKWVKERMPELEAIRNAVPEYNQTGERFSMQTLEADMWAMVTRHPENRRYADYYLCGALAEKDGNRFYEAFRVIAPALYPDGSGIPRLYQEALCPIVIQMKDIPEKQHIGEDVLESFIGFNELIGRGRGSEAKKKYSDTYWGYVFF